MLKSLTAWSELMAFYKLFKEIKILNDSSMVCKKYLSYLILIDQIFGKKIKDLFVKF